MYPRSSPHFFEEFWGYIPSIPRSTFPKFPRPRSIDNMTYSRGFPDIPRLFFHIIFCTILPVAANRVVVIEFKYEQFC